MKANEAPDKIYVVDSTFPDYVDFDGSPINTKKINDRDIEYTRTDAFIEKACEFISFNIADYIDVTHHGGIERVVLQERVIEDFRNYMKG